MLLQCSASCGEGQKSRDITCVDDTGQRTLGCDLENRPATSQLCDNGACPTNSSGEYRWRFPFQYRRQCFPPQYIQLYISGNFYEDLILLLLQSHVHYKKYNMHNSYLVLYDIRNF